MTDTPGRSAARSAAAASMLQAASSAVISAPSWATINGDCGCCSMEKDLPYVGNTRASEGSGSADPPSCQGEQATAPAGREQVFASDRAREVLQATTEGPSNMARPSYVSRTKVHRTRSRAVVRLEIRS